MALPPSSSQPLGKPLVSSPASQVQDPENGNPVLSLRRDGGNTSRAARTLRRLLGWMTPHEQMDYLRQKRDAKRWEFFRDELMRKWSNLNIIACLFLFCRTPSGGLITRLFQCGLIMGYVNSNYPHPERRACRHRAISTIIFANYVLSRASFALGIICLLSSLIAIGFGVGLNYVLVDVNGEVLMVGLFPLWHHSAISNFNTSRPSTTATRTCTFLHCPSPKCGHLSALALSLRI